jgi:DNA-binding CsgD family transcriptional regulator
MMAPTTTIGELLALLPLAASDSTRSRHEDTQLSGRCAYSTDEVQPGDLVLAVGIDSAEGGEFVTDCAARGAAAVVLRDVNGTTLPADLPLPVLALRADTQWNTVIEAIARLGATADEVAPPTSDLFNLVDAIALASGGSAIIEDASRRVVAYSSIPNQAIDEERERSILARMARHGADTDRAYQTVWSSNGVTRLNTPGYAPRMATVVRAGKEPLGTIWVVEGDEPLSADAERILARSVTSVAWYLLAAKRQAQPHTPRELAIVRALRGESLTELPEPFNTERFMLGCCVVEGPPLVAARVAELASLNLAAPATNIGRFVLAALEVAPGMAASDRRRIQLFAATAQRNTGVPVAAMVSEPLAFAMVSPTAGEMLRIAEAAGDCTNLPTEISAAVVRRSLLAAAITGAVGATPEFNDPQLAALTAKEPELGRTLLVYLESHSDTVETARLLTLHENTVRYRLRRIQQILGTDARDLDLLTTLAQIRAWANTHL